MQQSNIKPLRSNDQLFHRHTVLEGAYNVRDVGGYPTSDGYALKWGQLFRGDGLHRLTHADRSILIGCNICTVIDLRFSKEAEHALSQMMNVEGVRYEHMPLHDDPVAPAFSDQMNPARLPQTLDEYYYMVLDRCQKRFQTLFTLLTTPSTFPCLYHSTAGKDRTGMLTMLVLLALSVPREIIVEDYMMTAEYAAPLLGKLNRQMLKEGIDIEWHRRMLDCSPRSINRAIDYLNQRHGGIANYLRNIGVTETQVKALRDEMITTS